MSDLTSNTVKAKTPTRADWLRFGLLILLWSSSFALTKIAVTELSPTIVTALRIWIAIILLYGWMIYRKHKLPPIYPKPDIRWLWLLPVGLTGSALPFLLNAWALQTLDSGLVGILLATMPLSVAFIAHFTIAGDKMTFGKIAGLVLGLFGVVLLIGPSALAGLGGPTTIAQIIILVCAVMFAINSVLIHFMPETPPSVAATGMLLIGGLSLLPFAIFAGLQAQMPSLGAMLAILVLGLGATGIGSIFYMQTLRSAGPSFLATANYFVPPAAVLIGVAFLAETPSIMAFIALAVILLALFVERQGSK